MENGIDLGKLQPAAEGVAWQIFIYSNSDEIDIDDEYSLTNTKAF